MLMEIKKTQAVEKAECAGRRRLESSAGKLPLAMMMLCLVGMQGGPADAFTAYDCSN